MKKDGYYSSGEFARMAHVTPRTIRYYDKQNILKPSYVTESGARFYTDEDFARLSQILLLKYLGFSLDDIREMTIDDSDYHFMENSLNIQLKLVRDRIEQMQLVEKAIQDTTDAIRSHHAIDWNQMLDLIHLTGMEKSMKNQAQVIGYLPDEKPEAAKLFLYALQQVIVMFPATIAVALITRVSPVTMELFRRAQPSASANLTRTELGFDTPEEAPFSLETMRKRLNVVPPKFDREDESDA